MPISWQGMLQQYAGRSHREHVGKTDARIIDFIDMGHPALRRSGYRAMYYQIVESAGSMALFDPE